MTGDDGHMVFFGDCTAADDRDPYPTGLIPNTPHGLGYSSSLGNGYFVNDEAEKPRTIDHVNC